MVKLLLFLSLSVTKSLIVGTVKTLIQFLEDSEAQESLYGTVFVARAGQMKQRGFHVVLAAKIS